MQTRLNQNCMSTKGREDIDLRKHNCTLKPRTFRLRAQLGIAAQTPLFHRPLSDTMVQLPLHAATRAHSMASTTSRSWSWKIPRRHLVKEANASKQECARASPHQATVVIRVVCHEIRNPTLENPMGQQRYQFTTMKGAGLRGLRHCLQKANCEKLRGVLWSL